MGGHRDRIVAGLAVIVCAGAAVVPFASAERQSDGQPVVGKPKLDAQGCAEIPKSLGQLSDWPRVASTVNDDTQVERRVQELLSVCSIALLTSSDAASSFASSAWRACFKVMIVTTKLCWAPSCRSRTTRRRSSSVAATIRAREAARSERAWMLEIEAATSSVNSPIRSSVPAGTGSGCVETATMAPQSRPSTTIGVPTAERMPGSRTDDEDMPVARAWSSMRAGREVRRTIEVMPWSPGVRYVPTGTVASGAPQLATTCTSPPSS